MPQTVSLVAVMKAGCPFWPSLICQPLLICWTTAFSLHICMACLAYLARLLNVFCHICVIDSSLSASVVGSLHKRNFIMGFLRVLSLALFFLLCIPSHWLTNHQSSQICWQHTTNHQLHLTFIHLFTTSSSVLTVGKWMTCNRLKLNNDETKALVVGSHRRVTR